MALALKPGLLALAMTAAALAPRTALALGPRAPFAPPQAASAPAAETAANGTPANPAASGAAPAAAAVGLAGVRLGARPIALIDGDWRQLGQSVRGARVQAIDAHGVTLAHADGRTEQLTLMPADAWRAHPAPLKSHVKASPP